MLWHSLEKKIDLKKHVPKISEELTVVINLTPSNAWFRGISLHTPCSNYIFHTLHWLMLTIYCACGFVNCKSCWAVMHNYDVKKNESNRWSLAPKILLQRCIFYPVANEPDPKNSVKMQQKLPFRIFIVIYRISEWICFLYHFLFFLNPLDDQLSHFVLRTPWKEIYY